MFRSYNIYLKILDAFGLLSVALIALYLFEPESWRFSERQDGMVANVLSELIGIYIGVRLIDFFIRRNERHDRVRIRIVRVMRLFERLATDVLLHSNGAPIVHLRREFEWARSLTEQRNRYLSADEVADLTAFEVALTGYCALIPNFQTILHINRIDLGDTQKLLTVLGDVEKARRKAEQNILEETEEDSGI